MTKQQQQEADARAELRKVLRPGMTVYTSLRHVSASGMYRAIDAFIIRKGEPYRLSWLIARALDWRYDKRREAIGVGGCGMDMGFHIVNTLGYALFAEEASKATTKHANKLRAAILKADYHYFTQGRTPAPDPTTPGDVWYGGAGYALKHRWL